MEDLAEAYLKPANAILQVLGSDATDGLSKANVGELQAKYGLNGKAGRFASATLTNIRVCI